jgi:molybdopterin molybdotransferase
MISPFEAETLILSSVALLGTEDVPLARLNGRVLREPVALPRALPPYDRVTMDGIAIASAAFHAGRRDFLITGTQAAGAEPLTLDDSRHCIEAMTGAPLPHGTDCVVPVERIQMSGGSARIADDFPAVAQLNVHARGLDARAGAQILHPGVVLGPTEVAIIASAGFATASVSKSPRIAVISTGDEVIEPGSPIKDWQIYRSNAYAVVAALQRRFYSDLIHDHLPDDRERLAARLTEHLATCDVLILSGGVSMGKFDYVPQVLSELGVRVVFHQVAQRPGKPMWFGIGAQGQSVFALPGNPVSTVATLIRYAIPGLESVTGAHPSKVRQIALTEDFEVKPALAIFMPVVLNHRPDSTYARPSPTRGSGDFVSLLGTDGFVELPKGPRTLAQGTPVPFYSW